MVGHIQLSAYFCVTLEVRMVFTFVKGFKKSTTMRTKPAPPKKQEEYATEMACGPQI